MKSVNRSNVRERREDLSRFIVHLTKDIDPDMFEEYDGKKTIPARHNLISILRSTRIEARNYHCILNNKMTGISDKKRKELRVVCLTETPLNQLHLLIENIEGRRVELKPYGLIFHRDFIIQKRGQPAIYLNCYNSNRYLRDAANDAIALWKKEGKKNRITRLLPFINVMSEEYDFVWEREWRVLGDLQFTPKDIVAVILPESKEKDIRTTLARNGIPVISPRSTYEQIVEEFSSQLRQSKELHKAELDKLQKGV